MGSFPSVIRSGGASENAHIVPTGEAHAICSASLSVLRAVLYIALAAHAWQDPACAGLYLALAASYWLEELHDE